MKSLNKLKNSVTMLPLLILTAMFIFLPLLGMVKDSFLTKEGAVTVGNYIEVFAKAIYHYAIRNSLYLSIISTVIGIVIAFAVALSITLVGGKLQNIILSILNMVSNFAGIPLATAFIVILVNSGIFIMALKMMGLDWAENFNLYSVDGLLLLFIYFQIPLGTLMLLPAFQAIRQEWKEAADLMGASSLYYWARVGIPVMLPSIADTLSLLFANALTTYATVLMLTATNVPLLPIKIATMFTGEMVQQKELGSALTIVMLLIMFAFLLLMAIIKKLFCRGGNN